jgi:stalled ribosome alternative rescue factor ArfA
MADYKNYNEDRSKKLCFTCKDMLDAKLFRIKEKKHGRGKGKYITNVCKKCEQILVEEYRTTDIGIAAEIARRHKHVSKKEGLPYDLDKHWILDRLNSIEWKCELTGLPFNLKRSILDKRQGFQWDSISTDKISPAKGYTKDNVRFILNQINVFRQNHPDEQMFMLAQTLLDFRKKNDQ